MEEWNRAALVSLQGELECKVMLKTGLVDRLQKAAGGFMDEREELQWRVSQAHAEQMGDLVLIPQRPAKWAQLVSPISSWCMNVH